MHHCMCIIGSKIFIITNYFLLELDEKITVRSGCVYINLYIYAHFVFDHETSVYYKRFTLGPNSVPYTLRFAPPLLNMPIKRSFIFNSHDHPHQPAKEQPVIVMPMFEKPLTPSDVGKLNRLVIPKQHAEKHFPIARSCSGDSALLLSFEDEEVSGRWWSFRYSYWSSSQSYVLTKGWSRYVKEKGLSAGDVITFGCLQADSHHWFIGWRRARLSSVGGGLGAVAVEVEVEGGVFSGGMVRDSVVISGRPVCCLPQRSFQPSADGVYHATRGSVDIIQNNRAPQVAGNSRRLRLFGVNLECPLGHNPEPSTAGTSSPLSSLDATDQIELRSDQTFYPSGFPSNSNVIHQLI